MCFISKLCGRLTFFFFFFPEEEIPKTSIWVTGCGPRGWHRGHRGICLSGNPSLAPQSLTDPFTGGLFFSLLPWEGETPGNAAPEDGLITHGSARPPSRFMPETSLFQMLSWRPQVPRVFHGTYDLRVCLQGGKEVSHDPVHHRASFIPDLAEGGQPTCTEGLWCVRNSGRCLRACQMTWEAGQQKSREQEPSYQRGLELNPIFLSY